MVGNSAGVASWFGLSKNLHMARRDKHHIPQIADEFDAQWFSTTIGPRYGGMVTEVKREVIGEGIGFLESYIAARLLGEAQQMPRILS